MTGYGQAALEVGGLQIQIEAKSVNHRYCEVMIRMPREWLRYEEAVKKSIQQQVKRGRVDVFITMELSTAGQPVVEVNWPLIDSYLQAAEQVNARTGRDEILPLAQLLQLPDVMIQRNHSDVREEDVEQALMQCAEEAAKHLLTMRKREGEHLADDIRSRLLALQQFQGQLAAIAPGVADEYREKLRLRMKELLAEEHVIDDQRIAMEVAVFADRSNVDEELTRLTSHFAQGFELLQAEETVGRKLDFLVQEMNREVNTIGSKANHSAILKIVVEMKAELEKIREQVQNIE
jgi:uncharacterized protein (TIGR00255 family)